jgi:hypothetical protein
VHVDQAISFRDERGCGSGDFQGGFASSENCGRGGFGATSSCAPCRMKVVSYQSTTELGTEVLRVSISLSSSFHQDNIKFRTWPLSNTDIGIVKLKV